MLNMESISKRRDLKLLDFSKSAYYFNPKKEDETVVNEILRLAFKRKREGYRMIRKSMRKAGWRIDRKKIDRLYSQEDLKIWTKPRKKRKLADRQPIPIPTRPNEVWQ